MPTNPTTKSQVQAYQFVLRRMESALVRRDAVLLHEPMRAHLQAATVGLILGVLGLAAFFVLGLFKPASDIAVGDIVTVKGTTSVFVAVETDDAPLSLVPVFNVTSARLLVAALKPGTQPTETKAVAESALDGIPRLPQVGRPDWPQDLPAPERLVDGVWSVCDTATVREELLNRQAKPELSTTVIVGGERGQRLRDDQALLVTEESAGTYLLWAGKRLPVDLDDPAVRLAYELDSAQSRKISTGLLNTIPQGSPLTPPDIPDAAYPAPFPQLNNANVRIGEVVEVKRAAGQESFFFVLREGKQPVQRAVADLIRFAGGSTSYDFTQVTPQDIRKVPDAPESARKDFSDFPGRVPQVLTITETPVVCLVRPSADAGPVITVSTDEQLLRDQGVVVPGAASDQADRVLVRPGGGALVRGMLPDQPPDSGQLWLVTDQGLRYGVPSIEVARALGLGDQVALAPDSILRLLKEGPVLEPLDALRLFSPELAEEEAKRRAGR